MDTRSKVITALDIDGDYQPPELYQPIQDDVYEQMQKENSDFMAGIGRAITITEMPRLTGLSQMLKPGTLTIVAGNEGSGKTFFALECLFASYAKTKTGFYMPLEGRIDELFERVAMRTAKDWKGSIQLSGRESEAEIQEMGRDRAYILERGRNAINVFRNHISAPPGMTNDFATEWEVVATEAVRKMEKNRIVAVDNLSFVSFEPTTKTHDQGEFAKRLLNGAQHTGATCILINHTNKISRKERTGVMTNDDVSGSQVIQRMANCVIIITSHDTKESEVYVDGGNTKMVEHNKTIAIGKARHGKGAHMNIAFHFGQNGPTWEELGVIKHG